MHIFVIGLYCSGNIICDLADHAATRQRTSHLQSGSPLTVLEAQLADNERLTAGHLADKDRHITHLEAQHHQLDAASADSPSGRSEA